MLLVRMFLLCCLDVVVHSANIAVHSAAMFLDYGRKWVCHGPDDAVRQDLCMALAVHSLQ